VKNSSFINSLFDFTDWCTNGAGQMKHNYRLEISDYMVNEASASPLYKSSVQARHETKPSIIRKCWIPACTGMTNIERLEI
jgi:hypothetical protein